MSLSPGIQSVFDVRIWSLRLSADHVSVLRGHGASRLKIEIKRHMYGTTITITIPQRHILARASRQAFELWSGIFIRTAYRPSSRLGTRPNLIRTELRHVRNFRPNFIRTYLGGVEWIIVGPPDNYAAFPKLTWATLMFWSNIRSISDIRTPENPWAKKLKFSAIFIWTILANFYPDLAQA